VTLKTDFQDAAVQIINGAFASLNQVATITSVSNGPAKADGTFDESVSEQSVKVVVSSFKSTRESTQPVQGDDLKVYIARKGVSEKPDTNDQLTIGDVTYSIIAVMVDGADAAYVLHVRAL